MTKYLKPEFILALYLHVFYYTKFLGLYLPIPSTFMVGGASFGLALLAFLTVRIFQRETLLRWLVFLGGVSLVFIGSMLLAPNPFISQSFQNLILYGIIPLFILSLVTDVKDLLKGHLFFAFPTGLLLMTEPFRDYYLTGSYMNFGFGLYMTSATGLAIGYKLTRNRFYLLLYLLELGFIGIWGNKGAFIAGSILLVVLLYDRFNIWGKIGLVSGLSLLAVNLKNILLGLISWLIELGFSSYSLSTFKQLLTEDSAEVTSLRTDIWEIALQFGWEHYGGVGIGIFNQMTGIIYPHNVFLDFWVTFGLWGLIAFIIIFILSLKKTLETQNPYLKICRIGALLAWFMPLQFSLVIWDVQMFWLYFGLVFLLNDSPIREEKSITKL